MVEQQPDPVTGPGTPGQQMASELVGPRVQLAIGQDSVASVHGELAALTVVSTPVAPILEKVIETFARLPPDRVLRLLADQDAVSRRSPAEREINKIACPRIDDAPLNQTALPRGQGCTDGDAWYTPGSISWPTAAALATTGSTGSTPAGRRGRSRMRCR